MQNSSKKSLRPSPSQPNAAPPSKPDAPKAKPAAVSAPGRPVNTDVAFAGSGGKRLRLPVGFGYGVYLEGRQLGLFAISVALYIFAAVVASDWIYLLSAAFAVALVLGFVLPLCELAGLSASYTLPSEVSQLDAANVRVNIRRSLRLGPISWMVPTRALRMTINMHKRTAEGKPSEVLMAPEPVYVDRVDDNEWYSFPTPSLNRGIYYLDSVELSTCYPLGIVWWTRSVRTTRGAGKSNVTAPAGQEQSADERATLTVYPDGLPLSGNFLYRLTGIVSPMGHATSTSVITHQSSSFRSVREFRSGDSMRHIHWASTARTGTMLVREFDSEILPVFDILLNLRANYRSPEQFELTVKLVNSLILLGHSLGHMPRLLLNPPAEAPEMQALFSDLPSIPPGLGLMAEILARVEPITRVAANRMSFDDEVVSPLDTWSHVNERPLLTIIPTNEKIMKFAPGRGDVVCQPVELVEVSPNWQDEDIPLPGMESQGAEKAVNFKSARGASTKKAESDRKDLGPTSGALVARVEWEGDFDGL